MAEDGGVKYPKRDSHFAHKAFRLMTKTCLAMDIGVDAVFLLAVILHQEDAKRYRAAVSFYNDQLLSVLGFRKWDRLDRARRAAVDAGWLHYVNRGRRPGLYWILIPEELERVDDSPIDESPSKGYDEGSQTDVQPPSKGYDRGNDGSVQSPPEGTSTGSRPDDNLIETGSRPDDEGEPPTLFPNPTPIPKEEPPISPTDALQLEHENEFLTCWNETEGVKPTKDKRRLSDSRRRTFRTRICSAVWDWQAALQKFPLECTRGEESNWQPTIDWFLKPDSVTKILEGKYDFRKNDSRTGTRQRSAAEAFDPNTPAGKF